VIVVEECSPHLFLFRAELRSSHENTFLLERGVCNIAPAKLAIFIRPLLIFVVRRALVICPREPHES
jgi:hypothetical protein